MLLKCDLFARMTATLSSIAKMLPIFATVAVTRERGGGSGRERWYGEGLSTRALGALA